jgi:hypothetical protein
MGIKDKLSRKIEFHKLLQVCFSKVDVSIPSIIVQSRVFKNQPLGAKIALSLMLIPKQEYFNTNISSFREARR